MQHNKHTDLQQEPVISVKVFDLLVAGIAVLIIILGFRWLVDFAGLLLVVVLSGAGGYVGYRIRAHHRERAQIHAARLERYQMETRLLEPEAMTGNYPVYFDPTSHTLVRIQPGNMVQPVPQSYAPHVDYRLQNAKQEPLALPGPPAVVESSLALPGPLSMIEIMRRFSLSPENLFLALGRGGKHLTCSIDQFMHVAHDGPTGSGKTMQWKAELVMLLKADVLTFLANPHFAPVTKKGEDWRPIGRALSEQELPGHLPGLLYTFEQIRDFLKWLSQVEIDRRFEHQRAGRYDYLPLYGFIDEWAAQVAKYPECGPYMQDIIRRGRAVDVCISTNSQGFLVNDIGMSGASRENFQTAYHLGGSLQSASALLDMRQQEISKLLSSEQVTLGKGVALLRNNSVSDPAQLVRLPLADNDYVYYMLGRADQWQLPEFRSVSAVVSEEQPSGETGRETDTARLEAGPAGWTAVSETAMQASVIEAAGAVSKETKRRILRDIERGYSYRQVAANVGMSGGGYAIFQQICKELGYDTSKRNPHSKGGK